MRWFASACCAGLAFVAIAAGAAGTIRFNGSPAELVVSEVSERTVRIELFPLDEQGKPRPAIPSTVLVPFSVKEELRARELPREKQVRAGDLRVAIKADPLTVSVRRDGKLVQELVFDEAASTNAGVAFQTKATVLGLGEGAQQFDRRGAYYPMEPSWGGWNRPVLGSVVPSPFVIGTEGWALFAHRPEGHFDLRNGRGKFIPRYPTNAASLQSERLLSSSLSSIPNGGEGGRRPGEEAIGRAALSGLDLFVVALDEPADALTEYTRLTGKPVMPPKWALGYFQSHRTLAGPDEPLRVARTFREKNLPCDAVIYLGTGYCTNGWNTGHGSLDFNPNAFVADNIKALHDLNFKLVLHVNRAPRNLLGSFVESPKDSGRTKMDSDPGPAQIFGRTNRSVHIRDYWARHHDIFTLGVDGWWPDDGDELPLEARLTRHRCYYEGPLQDRPNVRPWSLHRTGYAGSQRYGGWIWSGDVDGKWETLAAHVSVGINHGLSLTPFWGSDTGGFYPTRELTGELYARWFQFSAFCPSFRSHGRTWKLRLPWGWNTGEFGPIEHGPAERRGFTGDIRKPPQHPDPSELHNAGIEPIARKYLELRYRLLPYNYTVARDASDTGLPMMRALWLHYPNDTEAVKLGNEYLWGRDLLVAPVLEPGAKSRRVYLPEGMWRDWWTGEKVEGKRWVERPVDLATLPLYVRAGAIIPLDPVRQFTSQAVSGPTTLRVHPGADGEFTLYDDDGQSLGYRDGSDTKTIWIRMRWDDSARRLTLEPDKRMKKWPGEMRVFSVETAGSDAPSKRVEFRGKRVSVKL
ncbi:MAG TPA: TIM-barrel domain-containing protein [Verrucomicrobiae bacterium]|nr:TIM-barrel domain-containing protein [Verrucomicrobiae bacterium]